MKKTIRLSLFAIWVLVASVFLTRWWMASPSSVIIQDFPPSLWKWLFDIFNAHDQKSVVIIWVGLCLSIITVSLLTALTCFLFRRFKMR